MCTPRVQTASYGVIMEAMTKSWTDERLEERFDRIDERFDEVGRRFDETDRRIDQMDRRIDEMDRRIDQRFDRVESDSRELRGEMKAGFDRIDARFDALHHLLLRLGGVTIAALLGLLATQL